MFELCELPININFTILANVDLQDLGRFCQISKKANRICSNKDFWVYKYIFEYGTPYPGNAEFEPRIEYVLQLRQVQLRRLEDLEIKFLAEMRVVYTGNALKNQEDQLERVFKETFLTQKTHQFHELDFLITDFSTSGYDNETVYNRDISESFEEVIGNILAVLDEFGIVEVKSSVCQKDPLQIFIMFVYTCIMTYRKDQEPIYTDLHSVNQYLINLTGQETYFLAIDQFKKRLPPPSPNLGPFTLEFPIGVHLPPPLKPIIHRNDES